MTTATEENKEKELDQPKNELPFEPKQFLKEMMEAGVHLGHQTKYWNPRMKQYIHGQRNGVYIINLAKTITHLLTAADFMKKQAKMNRNILFVGTTKQATDLIKEEAERSDIYFINQRWLGGLITNFETVRNSLNKLRDLESQRDSGAFQGYGKKEIARINREINKLNKSLGGLKKMRGRPEVLFVVNPNKDLISIKEAKKAGIKVVCIADTNFPWDPKEVDYVIPANDDSIRSIRLITKIIADSVIDGKGKTKKVAA